MQRVFEILTDRAIDCFVHYEGKRADDVSAGRFAVRQLIAQAVRHVSLTPNLHGSRLYRKKAICADAQMDAEVARRRGATAQDEQTNSESLKGMYGASK